VPGSLTQLRGRTRNVGEDAMSILNSSGFEIDVNPKDGPASREWILEHVSDPDVVAVCVMHGQPGDKVDEEFLGKCAKGVKVVSTFSVGFGESPLVLTGREGSSADTQIISM
jgi:glyoxylate/hydroxypyruvate reductase